MKAIKQDQRLERPEAAGNEDWVWIGDVDDTNFSICRWLQLVFAFHGAARLDGEPFFVQQPQLGAPQGARPRPLTYAQGLKDVRKLWARASSAAAAKLLGLHGLRVSGYNCTKRGVSEEFAVAHGGWRSTAHRRYDRFQLSQVVAMPARIVEQLDEVQPEPMPPPVDARPPVVVSATPGFLIQR